MKLIDLLNRAKLRVDPHDQKAVGQAIGVSEAWISRLFTGKATSMDVVPCLRLAALLDESPSVVLRAAGKAEEARLFEAVYGQPRELPAAERELLEKARALGGAERVLSLIATLEATLRPDTGRSAPPRESAARGTRRPKSA